MNRTRRPGFQYFTLIEMIVILVIMAVIAAIAAPRLGNFVQNVKLNTTVHKFKSFLEAARNKAISNQNTCRLVIKPGWRKLYLEENPPLIITSPQALVEYIKNKQSSPEKGKKTRFTKVSGEFSGMELPTGVSFKYISVSGQKKNPGQAVIITFDGIRQAEEIDIVFQDKLKSYQGIRLPAGSGIPKKLNVYIEN